MSLQNYSNNIINILYTGTLFIIGVYFIRSNAWDLNPRTLRNSFADYCL